MKYITHGSHTWAKMDEQRENADKLHKSTFPTIYNFFEQNYQIKQEVVPIHQRNKSDNKTVTIGYYQLDDITDLLTRSGVNPVRINRFHEDLVDCSPDGYFGRESFVTRLSKKPNVLQQVVDYCARNS